MGYYAERSLFYSPDQEGGRGKVADIQRGLKLSSLRRLPELKGIPSDPNKVLLAKIHEITAQYEGIVPQEVLENSVRLVLDARAETLAYADKSPRTVSMIERSLANRFLPYVVEANIIASEVSGERAQKFTTQTLDFLGNPIVAIIACPDGRIMALAMGDPGIVTFNRRLRGLPPVRRSTKDGEFVLDDPDISGSINFKIEERLNSGKAAELIEFMGPHIHSGDPVRGCGDASGTLATQGHYPMNAMAFGGINEYFSELGDGFFAANNNARRAGGNGTSIDLVHDAYSQGLIVGLKEARKDLNLGLNLRENLLDLASHRKIIMTEALKNTFRKRIRDVAKSLRVSNLDLRDPTKFADNIIALGSVSQEITRIEEGRGYPFIPESIKGGKSEVVFRTLAYTLIRSTVYQELGNVTVGNHSLITHPEQLIVAGHLSPIFNVNTIAFSQKTARGEFNDGDIAGVKKLYALSQQTMPEFGIDLTGEGRIVVTTGSHDPSAYADNKAERQEKHRRIAVVQNNEAKIREQFPRSVSTGETIVIGAIINPATREITSIV